MKTLICAAALIALVCLLTPQPSHSWTISVNCAHNPVPPPSLPYENVLCTYAWAPGGQLFNTGGQGISVLQYFPSGGTPYIADVLDTDIFALAGTTSPLTTWIACTNVSGSFRLYMDGYLYRYVVQMNGPGFWSQQDYLIDAKFAFVYEPLRTC